MDGVFTCQPEGFDALRVQPSVVNRLCRSLHGAFYSLLRTRIASNAVAKLSSTEPEKTANYNKALPALLARLAKAAL